MAWVNDIIQGILLGGLYALFAAGLSLVFGVMRLVNLAHGDLSILAAFVAFVIIDQLGINPFLTIPIVMVIMALLGYGLQRGLFNPALEEGVLPPILVTFGISIIIQNVLVEIFTANSRGLDAGVIEARATALTDQIAIGWFPFLTLVTAVVVLLALQVFLSRTRTGRAFRATSDHQRAAQLMGIDNRHLYGLATALSLAMVAVAGIFVGIRTTFSPFSGPLLLIFAYEVVIIGGLGSLWGTLIGGFLLGIAQTVGSHIDQGYGVLAGHILFLAILVFRPTGLFSRQLDA